MLKTGTIIALIADFLRALLIEALSDRVRGLRLPHRLDGMGDVRRHVQRRTRRRLFNRLSTTRKRR